MFLSFPGLLILNGFRRGLNIFIIKESSQRPFVLVFFLVDVGEQTTKKEINGDSSPRLLWAGWRPLYRPPASTFPDNNTSSLHYYITPNTNTTTLLSTFFLLCLACLIEHFLVPKRLHYYIKWVRSHREVYPIQWIQYYMGAGGEGVPSLSTTKSSNT